MYAIIDTLDIKIEYNNIEDIAMDYTEIGSINDKKTSDNIKKQHRVVVLNPNKATTRYSIVKSMNEFNKVCEDTMELITVIDKDKVRKSRVDVAFDCNMDFDNNSKFFQFFIDLLSYDEKGASIWASENIRTTKKSQVYAKASLGSKTGTDVLAYDKQLESDGKHISLARVEVRMKKLGNKGEGTFEDIEVILKKLIKRLGNIEDNLEALEINTARLLIERWEYEKARDPKLTLSKFVSQISKYYNYIYTNNIMKELYKASGLKGSYNKWVEKLRKNSSNTIVFYTKADIVKFKKAMIKALKIYMKN